MANLALLRNIKWSVSEKPTPDLVKDWTQVVLPGEDFKIIYPVGVPDPEEDDLFQLVDLEIPYQAEGQPVTIVDLLTTIYEFYQEPLSHDDPLRNPPDFVKRSDPIGDQTAFNYFNQVGVNKYKLSLGLVD